jgi:hypothetical protein
MIRDIIVNLRKIILILISTFFSDSYLQAYFAISFLILAYFYHFRTQAYFDKDLNRLEGLSLISTGILLYCGLAFISGKKESFINY